MLYKFKLEQEVILSNKPEQSYIVIGRGDFISQPRRYMLQEEESYSKDGYRFDKGYWEYEDKLIEVIGNEI